VNTFSAKQPTCFGKASLYGLYSENAAQLAAEFVVACPAGQTPATTEGREGFFHLVNIGSTVESARVDMIIRCFFLRLELSLTLLPYAAARTARSYHKFGTFEGGFGHENR
jgi:di/tripeptidase